MLLATVILSLLAPQDLRVAVTEGAVVCRSEAPVELRLYNPGSAMLAGELVAWDAPDARLLDLPERIELPAGSSRTLRLRCAVDPRRPAGAVDLRLEVREGEIRHALVELPLFLAPGNDLLRIGFEPTGRGGRSGRPAGLSSSPREALRVIAEADAPVGAGVARVAAPESPARVRVWGGENPRLPTDPFGWLVFWLRGEGEIRVHADGALLARKSAPEVWRFVSVPLWSVTSIATLELEVQGEVFFDELALTRDVELRRGEALESLCQRFLALPREMDGSGIERQLLAEVEALDGESLDAGQRVDRELLHHGLQLRLALASLPAKEEGQPAGRARFAAMLRHRHHLDLEPEQLAEIGREQVRVHQQMLAELAEEIAPGSDWRQVVELLKGRHPSPEELPEFAQRAMDKALRFTIDQGLVTVPMAARSARIQVVTDGRRSRTYPFGGYGGARPSPDGYQGTYFVSPPADWMTEAEAADRIRGNHDAWTRVVALHEIVPGHHLQTVVHRMRGLSRFRRAFYSTLFAEGWALYCEEMLFRAGFFPDPDTRFTQLHMRLWRAARIVIDASLHTGAMDMEQAAAFLVDEVAFDPGNARAEVLRYIDNPTRPMSYLMGFLAIQELFADAERDAGADRFDDRAFRDRLLSFGPIPWAAVRTGLGLDR